MPRSCISTALCISATLVLTLSSLSALAQETEETEPRQGKIDVSGPAPAAPVARSYKVHDGFYARGGVGFGYSWITFDEDNTGVDLSGNAPAFSVDLMLGGSPSPGMVLGGALLANGAISMSLELDGTEVADTNVGWVVLGPFFDAFPNPKGGWHLGGMVGVAGVDLGDAVFQDISSAQGGGGAAWVGHDWWVADEWSTGALLRFSGLFTGNSSDTADVASSAFGLTLMITALYH